MGLNFLGRKKKTDHERARELLSEYMDRRLTPEGTAGVELHLRECESCSDELQALQTTRQMLHGIPPVRLPRSFILEAAPRPTPMPRSFFWLRTATATAAAAFVALLAVSAVLPMAGAPASVPAALQPMQAPARATANDQAVTTQAKPAATGQPDGAKAAAAPGASGAPEAATTMAQEPQKREAATDSFGAAQPEPAAPASAALWAEEPRPAQGPSGLALLRAMAAGLALLLGVATAGVWWGHRRRNR